MLIPKKVKEMEDGTRSSLFANDIRRVSVLWTFVFSLLMGIKVSESPLFAV